MKDAPNHVLTKMIGLAQTSHEILKDSDVTIFLVVISDPDQYGSTVIVPVYHYTHSVWRLIQYVYDHKFSSSVRHSNHINKEMSRDNLKDIFQPLISQLCV